MTAVRSAPCQACPYRRDVPSGVWSADDYARLPPYDRDTFAQPTAAFACHATPEHLCNGWAVVGTQKVPHERDLLAARFGLITGEVPSETVPLFDSHTEAAEHGLSRLAEPDADAVRTQEILLRKYERLSR